MNHVPDRYDLNWPHHRSSLNKRHLSCYPLQWTAQHHHRSEIASPVSEAHMMSISCLGENAATIPFIINNVVICKFPAMSHWGGNIRICMICMKSIIYLTTLLTSPIVFLLYFQNG